MCNVLSFFLSIHATRYMTNIFGILLSDSLGYFFEPDFPALFKSTLIFEKPKTKAYIPCEAHAVIINKQVPPPKKKESVRRNAAVYALLLVVVCRRRILHVRIAIGCSLVLVLVLVLVLILGFFRVNEFINAGGHFFEVVIVYNDSVE